MPLLKAILESNYLKVAKYINKGAEINAILNGHPPRSILDIAIETDADNHSSQSSSIITLLKENGAKTYTELINPIHRANLPPLSVKGTARGNIKKTGIAGLPRRNRRTRKNRR